MLKFRFNQPSAAARRGEAFSLFGYYSFRMTKAKNDKRDCSYSQCASVALRKAGSKKRGVRRCGFSGCTNFSNKKEFCHRHSKVGCNYPNCTNKAVQASVCRQHGAPQARRCGTSGCSNIAVKGGVCQRHGAKKKTCQHPGCSKIAQTRGVCRSHGATVKTCSHTGCSNNSVNSGVCCRHGAIIKKCGRLECSNISTKGGFCRRHGTSATHTSSDTDRLVLMSPPGSALVCQVIKSAFMPCMPKAKQASSPLDEPVIHRHSVVATMASETESPVVENHLSLQQMHDKNRFSKQNPRENEEIDMDTILQLPFCITYNFRKVGFAKLNNVLRPVLFLGPNDAPAFVRKEWKILFSNCLRQGAPMVHLVAFFGQKEVKKKFGLVTDAYLYDYALEAKFRMMSEQEINTKLLKGETLDESDLQFHRALADLSFARRQPEDDRWDWKTPRFMF